MVEFWGVAVGEPSARGGAAVVEEFGDPIELGTGQLLACHAAEEAGFDAGQRGQRTSVEPRRGRCFRRRGGEAVGDVCESAGDPVRRVVEHGPGGGAVGVPAVGVPHQGHVHAEGAPQGE